MNTTELHQVQKFISEINPGTKTRDFEKNLEGLFLLFHHDEKYGGFLLRIDDENPNETRSAGIDITHHLEFPTGIMVYGKKTGRLSAHDIYGKEFYKILLWFPKPEDPKTFQRQEKFSRGSEARNDFMKALSERTICLVGAREYIDPGPGKELFLKEN